jgi:hypothetical protein
LFRFIPLLALASLITRRPIRQIAGCGNFFERLKLSKLEGKAGKKLNRVSDELPAHPETLFIVSKQKATGVLAAARASALCRSAATDHRASPDGMLRRL